MRRTFFRSLISLTAAVVLTWAGFSHAAASASPARPAVAEKPVPAVANVAPVAAAVTQVIAAAASIDVGVATSSAMAAPTSAAATAPAATAPATTAPATTAPARTAPATTAPATTAAVTTAPATTAAVTTAPATTAAVTSPAGAASPQISNAHLRFGLGTPGGFYDDSELPPVESAVGEVPSVILAYSDFTQAAPIAGLDAVTSRGQTPLLTWEPWQAGSADQPNYSLGHIISGDYDTYIRSWASDLKSWGKPVMLRFAHEMNGNWYPWSEQVNGNQPGQYVAAWRHVHDIFTRMGDHNVSWVWSPNVVYDGSIALHELYPGPGYVDVVAMDGYNWGTTHSDSVWTSPADLFGSTLSQVRRIAPGLPIIIGETASAESGGSKADWITTLFSYLTSQPDVTAVVWFDYNKEADWRINSSDASVAAFKAALSSRS